MEQVNKNTLDSAVNPSASSITEFTAIRTTIPAAAAAIVFFLVNRDRNSIRKRRITWIIPQTIDISRRIVICFPSPNQFHGNTPALHSIIVASFDAFTLYITPLPEEIETSKTTPFLTKTKRICIAPMPLDDLQTYSIHAIVKHIHNMKKENLNDPHCSLRRQ